MNKLPTNLIKTERTEILVLNQNTAWKMFRYGVFSGPYFPVFGDLLDAY